MGALCGSVEDRADFATAKFEEDVAEGMMIKMSLRDFKARYGEHRAIAALAVIVEDEAIGKKRMIHDATHGVHFEGPWEVQAPQGGAWLLGLPDRC